MDKDAIQALRLLRMNLERTKMEIAEQLHAIEAQIDQLLPSPEPVDRNGWRGEIANW